MAGHSVTAFQGSRLLTAPVKTKVINLRIILDSTTKVEPAPQLLRFSLCAFFESILVATVILKGIIDTNQNKPNLLQNMLASSILKD